MGFYESAVIIPVGKTSLIVPEVFRRPRFAAELAGRLLKPGGFAKTKGHTASAEASDGRYHQLAQLLQFRWGDACLGHRRFSPCSTVYQ